MMTDPKSGDYLAWFFGTNEQTRGQMAYFLKLGCPVALRPQPNEKDTPRPFADFDAPPILCGHAVRRPRVREKTSSS
jgi:hypothetical protein